MKTIALAAALLVLGAATPALADGHMEKAEDTATEQAAAAKPTIDSPIESLMADAEAKAVVVKHFGGQDVSAHPMYDQFKAMSLKAVAPFSQGMITDEMIAAIEADLAALSAAGEEPAPAAETES